MVTRSAVLGRKHGCLAAIFQVAVAAVIKHRTLEVTALVVGATIVDVRWGLLAAVRGIALIVACATIHVVGPDVEALRIGIGAPHLLAEAATSVLARVAVPHHARLVRIEALVSTRRAVLVAAFGRLAAIVG